MEASPAAAVALVRAVHAAHLVVDRAIQTAATAGTLMAVLKTEPPAVGIEETLAGAGVIEFDPVLLADDLLDGPRHHHVPVVDIAFDHMGLRSQSAVIDRGRIYTTWNADLSTQELEAAG